MEKFQRNYSLRVQTDVGYLTITPPFTIEFDITRNTLSSANVCQVRIYNLSERNRNAIRFNAYDYNNYKAIELKAGYGTNLYTVFKGNISEAWSIREGTNFITQIECYDGGFAFANGKFEGGAGQFPAGTPTNAALSSMAAQLPNTSVGTIGSYPGVLARGNSYTGSITEALTQASGGGFFIDNEKVNIIGTNEYIPSLGSTLIINSATGLLGTPVRERNIMHFEMLFEPALMVGEKISLQSSTASNYNGEYKVTAVKHRGMISEAVCGAVITTGEFFYDKLTPALF